ncbi:TPA: hypothetical protein ACGY2Z_001606 [Listeria monocytogenes]|nr:hypothetical protein [Listeria monocytogenes]
MGKIQIDNDTMNSIGNKMMEIINVMDELIIQLDKTSDKIDDEFKGSVLSGFNVHFHGLKKNMRTTIADTVSKNYNDLKIIQESFKAVDASFADQMKNNYQTSDYSVSTNTIPVNDVSGHTNTTYTIETGTQYERK